MGSSQNRKKRSRTTKGGEAVQCKHPPPSPPKNPQKNSTQPKIPHTKNENKKKLKRKKGAPK